LRISLIVALALLAATAPLHAATEVPTQRIFLDPPRDAPDEDEPANPSAIPSDAFKPYSAAPPATGLPMPQVHYGDDGLPEPVKAKRDALLAAALSGDPEALRPIIEAQPKPPHFAEQESEDKIDTLKAESGDDDGIEILAILADILDAGWVVEKPGTPEETYVWPWFSQAPPDKLTPAQMVEVYRVLTVGDYAETAATGAYTFYKVKITADGTWTDFSMPEVGDDDQ